MAGPGLDEEALAAEDALYPAALFITHRVLLDTINVSLYRQESIRCRGEVRDVRHSESHNVVAGLAASCAAS